MPKRLSRLLVVAPVCLLFSVFSFFFSFAAETVDLPAEPTASRSVVAEELWRLGGEDEEVLLGLIVGGVLDEDGNVLLVDRQLAHVLVVAPDGGVIGTLGREGEGPGELRRPQSVFVAGDRVGLVQGYPGKIIYLDREGLPAGQVTIGDETADGGLYAIRGLRCGDGFLVASLDRSTFDFDKDTASTRSALAVLDPGGTVTAELVTHETDRAIRNIVMDEAAVWAEYAAWAVSPRGLVATTAERDAWAVNERDTNGRLLRTLRRPLAPRRRSDEEKERATEAIHVAVATGTSTFDRRPLDTDPAIVGLDYAADGRLFVTTCWNAAEQLTAGTLGRYDVVSPAGEYVEELTIEFPGHDPERDLVVFLDGVHFLVIRNFEDAEAAIYADLLPESEREDLADAEPLEAVLVRLTD